MRQEIENMINKFEKMNYARGFALGALETYICLVGDGFLKKEDAISKLNGILDDYEQKIISIERFGAIIVDPEDIKGDA